MDLTEANLWETEAARKKLRKNRWILTRKQKCRIIMDLPEAVLWETEAAKVVGRPQKGQRRLTQWDLSSLT